MFHRWQRSRCARLISYPVSNSRCQAVSFGWLPWPVVPNNDVEARVGGFISGVRHAVAAQAITARRFRFQRFPVPGVHASPHQPKRRIEVGLSVEAGLWSGQGPHPPIAPPLGRPWGLSIVQIPSHQEIGPTPALHPIRRVVVVTEACGRTRQGGEMHPASSPFSGPVDSGRAVDSRAMGPIGFRERPFACLQIRVCVAPAQAWTVARVID